jgi:hypothetical protein
MLLAGVPAICGQADTQTLKLRSKMLAKHGVKHQNKVYATAIGQTTHRFSYPNNVLSMKIIFTP